MDAVIAFIFVTGIAMTYYFVVVERRKQERNSDLRMQQHYSQSRDKAKRT